MSSRLSIHLGLLLCITATSGRGDAATLFFEKEAEIKSDRIRLSDIARIEGADKSIQGLMNADLGKAPVAGRTEKLPAEQVARWIGRRYPQFAPIKWEGADVCLITTKSQSISAESIAEKAKAVLSAASGGSQWHLSSNQSVHDLLVRDLPYELEVNVLRATGECERVMVRVDAAGNGRVLGSATLWFSPIPSNTVTENKNEAACKQLSKFAGGLLKNSLLEHKTAVTKMETVDVEMQGPAFLVKTTGTALSSGKVGEMVRVRREGGIDSFMAMVIARGRVQVVEGEHP